MAPVASDVKPLHPIHHLLDKAKAEWHAKLQRQSKSLAEAKREYQRRYHRAAPPGFDQWFEYAQRNRVILIDEYDQIERDMLPLRGLPPRVLRERAEKLVSDETNYYQQGSFTIHVRDGSVAEVTGPFADHQRADAQADLMADFVEWLPDMRITMWLHDTPVMHIASDLKERLIELASDRRTMPESEVEDWRDVPDLVGWETFCPASSNLRRTMSGIEAGSRMSGQGFVSDHAKAMDVCRHPAMLATHSLTSNYGIGPRAVPLYPLFSHSKMPLFSDLLITPLEQYETPVGPDPAWVNKKHNKLLWRGGTTGSRYDRETLWRPSQRSRLNLRAPRRCQKPLSGAVTNHKLGRRKMLSSPLTAPHADAGAAVTFETDLETVNSRYFDVAFTGEPVQCREWDGTCDAVKRTYRFDGRMGPEEANDYRYVIDVDGNGWSGRFHRLMASRSAVLKSTGFIEWYQDRIQPWLHYIPIDMSYGDLHNTMAFFLGDADGNGAHDEIGRQIGEAGRQWTAEHWRMEDMRAYMMRLYLEYAAVLNRADV